MSMACEGSSSTLTKRHKAPPLESDGRSQLNQKVGRVCGAYSCCVSGHHRYKVWAQDADAAFLQTGIPVYQREMVRLSTYKLDDPFAPNPSTWKLVTRAALPQPRVSAPFTVWLIGPSRPSNHTE